VTFDSIKVPEKSIYSDSIRRNGIKESKGSLGRRGDFSSSEPSSGEKPVR